MLPEEDREAEPGSIKAVGVLQLCLRRSWLFGNLGLRLQRVTIVSCLCREGEHCFCLFSLLASEVLVPINWSSKFGCGVEEV